MPGKSPRTNGSRSRTLDSFSIEIAGEGHETFATAGVAAYPHEAVDEDPAAEVGAELPLDEARDGAIPLAGACEEGLELRTHDVVEHALFGATARVAHPVRGARTAGVGSGGPELRRHSAPGAAKGIPALGRLWSARARWRTTSETDATQCLWRSVHGPPRRDSARSRRTASTRAMAGGSPGRFARPGLALVTPGVAREGVGLSSIVRGVLPPQFPGTMTGCVTPLCETVRRGS